MKTARIFVQLILIFKYRSMRASKEIKKEAKFVFIQQCDLS